MTTPSDPQNKERFKESLIDQLVKNTISHTNLNWLMEKSNADDLKEITQRVFDLNESDLIRKIAIGGMFKRVNSLKNNIRNERYFEKVSRGFRTKLENKIVFVEGDSWFNYPIVLTDIIDWIIMNDNLAVYSSAAGGDWLQSILASREYVDGLSIHEPNFFLVSGGGNDVGGASRVALMVKVNTASMAKAAPSGTPPRPWAYEENGWVQYLEKNAYERVNKERLNNAIPWISKDYFALIMLFRLQYFNLFNNILTGGQITQGDTCSKFKNLIIVTQGYDYLIPSNDSGWGFNLLEWYVPALRLIGHGKWLKKPLMIKGITDEKLQKDILYVMIYFFNEMLIELGHYFWMRGLDKRIYHIDSRGWIKKERNEWLDEIHPKPYKWKGIAKTYTDCINRSQYNEDLHDIYKNVFKVLNHQI